MTQPPRMRTFKPSALPWALAVLAMIAGATLFLITGGVAFDLAEVDSSAGPWSWLAGGGVLLAVAGFLSVLFLASNSLIRRQRASILPTTKLR